MRNQTAGSFLRDVFMQLWSAYLDSLNEAIRKSDQPFVRQDEIINSSPEDNSRLFNINTMDDAPNDVRNSEFAPPL